MAFTPPLAPVGVGPAVHGVVVVPSDITVLSPTRGLWIGAAGNVAVVFAADASAVTLIGVPAGTRLEVCVTKVMATNTTATSIVALS